MKSALFRPVSDRAAAPAAAPVAAIATNKLQGTFGVASSSYAFWRAGHVDIRALAAPIAATALGAVAGMMIAPIVFLDPNMMAGVLLYAFAAALMGGIDNPVGAVVGGFIVGVHLIAVTAIYWMTIVSIISAVDYFIGFWKKIDHASDARRKRRSFVLSRKPQPKPAPPAEHPSRIS